MKSLLFYILLMSCSSVSHEVKLREAWIVSSTSMHEYDARKLIQQKIKFLELTYEQFLNPDYQTVKWREACLATTSIGKISEDGSNLLSVSTLFTDGDFHTGLCNEDKGTKKAKFVFLFCRDKRKFYQIRCHDDECGNFSWDSLC